ncbi:SGNH/GDSL hydrolase family protein [Haloechinothrix sp. YIM 98757]|uniref:SGNH/GDSL hydrolase family protein n=1 Tax=Haloechinothrix aidingensis TaxID=2752311 RepID=A0A838ACX0_9PSEU|nr:SGNH/GDSL hydrolase family protein [Haloechinothrix aidingensis]MBA0127126.1 SGNH/GDSL hydrolase family protein [Haloechinothrix aidingensis]
MAPRSIGHRRTLHGLLALALVTVLVPGLATASAAASTDEYAALGDSAASGNGTRNPDLDLECYRSSDAYGPLIEEERTDTSLVFPACQGAETPDIVKDQSKHLSEDTDYVTVSIGGNDIGFADIILNCANHWDEEQCLETVDDANRKIEEELPDKLDAAYAAITDNAPDATVMSVGYPRFFSDDVSCADADGISPAEGEALNGLADNLDAKIAERSDAAGITYIGVIEQFTGHDVCADDPYVNGKVEPNVADMYHPSPAGYRDGYKPLIRDVMG